MNRRRVLQGLAALPLMATFPGCCGNDDKKDDAKKQNGGKPGESSEASGIRTLQIHLEGPFAVVQQKDRNYRIKAYVPYDDDRRHEFRFSSPLMVEDKHKSYHFKLEEDGLELSARPPYIDHGFDGFNVRIPEWHIPPDSFISLDLPAPDVITYVPPAVSVLFQPPKGFTQGQFTTLPVNHILEYRVRESCKVRLRSKQLGDCTPLSCDDMYQQQMQLRKDLNLSETQGLQSPSMGQELIRCSQSDVCIYFLGVGLVPLKREEISKDILVKYNDHAVNFFNNKILPSLYGKLIPPDKQIADLNFSPCSKPGATAMSPVMIPAVQRFPFPQARVIPAASTENCTVPAATATSLKTSGQ